MGRSLDLYGRVTRVRYHRGEEGVGWTQRVEGRSSLKLLHVSPPGLLVCPTTPGDEFVGGVVDSSEVFGSLTPSRTLCGRI